jgi:hypothetical protein
MRRVERHCLRCGLAALVLGFIGYPTTTFPQTALEIAKEQAEIEKARAEAAESRAKTKKSELEVEQAEAKSKLELEKLQQERDDKQRAAIKDASKSLSDTLKGEVKDITISGTAIEARALTYRALAPVAKQLMLDVTLNAPQGVPVVVADEQLLNLVPVFFSSIAALQQLSTSYAKSIAAAEKAAANLRTEYTSLEQKDLVEQRSPGPGVALALEGFSAIASLVHSFQTRFNITSEDITIDRLALDSAIINAWRCQPSVKPTLVVIPTFGVPLPRSALNALVSKVPDLQQKGSDTEVEISTWLAGRKAELPEEPKKEPKKESDANKDAKAKKKQASKAKLAEEQAANNADNLRRGRKAIIAEMEDILGKLKVANQKVEQAMQALTATTDKTPVSPLVQMFKAERMAKAITDNVALLNTKVVAAGGNALATNNFWTGPKLFHSGGAVVSYTLTLPDGTLIAGGNLDAHTGYIRLKRTDSAQLGQSWTNRTPPPKKPAMQADDKSNLVCD